jgi:hypothetical protein
MPQTDPVEQASAQGVVSRAKAPPGPESIKLETWPKDGLTLVSLR